MPLFFAIARLAMFRFNSPADIDAATSTSTASPTAIIYQAILQNTLEQALLAFVLHLAWAAMMPNFTQSVPAVFACLFFVGRVFFIAGYDKGAPGRGVGFGMTFYASALMMLSMVSWRIYELAAEGRLTVFLIPGSLLVVAACASAVLRTSEKDSGTSQDVYSPLSRQ
eukprot:TRINITY_DN14900_c0_g1_i4.p1 TRINITY_DN14900_c0_g1~~TRINITY_DN14900_c0_g1_i4.p1  ORF type:complete len:168 (+),score=34.12 TRINITY_DN14900_c0_g1_i4:284-787(+)